MDLNFEISNSNAYVFTDTSNSDALIYTYSPNQRILIGTESNTTAALIVQRDAVNIQRFCRISCNLAFSSNVGIGTSNVKAGLHNARDLFIDSNNFAWPVDHGTGIYMRYSTHNTDNGAYIQSVNRNGIDEINQNMYLHASNFHVLTGTTLSNSVPRFTVTSDGLIGINTSNPTQMIDINGDISLRSNIILNSNCSMIMGTGNTGLAGRVGFSIYNSNSLDIIGTANASQTGRFITFYVGSNQTGGSIGRALFNGGNVILNSGFISIGVSNPLGPLHIARNNTTSNNIIIEGGRTSDGTNEGLSSINFNGYFSTNNMRVNTNKNRWRVFVDQRATADTLGIDTFNGTSSYNYITCSNSNIGINKTNPVGRLHIVGNSVFAGTDGTQSSNNPLTLEDTSGSAMRIVHKTSDSINSTIYNYEQTKNVYWGESSDSGFYMFRGKSFAIGSSNPDKRLCVGEGSSDTSSAIKLNTGDGDKIYLTNSNNGSKIAHSNSWNLQLLAGQSNSANGLLSFWTGSATGYVERMRIDNLGNTGINTAPSATLHVVTVNSTRPAIINGVSATTPVVQIVGTTSKTTGIEIADTLSSTNGWIVARDANSNMLSFSNTSGTLPFRIYPNWIVEARSNLGVSISNPEAQLHVQSNAQIGTQNIAQGPLQGQLVLCGNNSTVSRKWTLITGGSSNTVSAYNTQRLRILDGTNERLTIDTLGYIGIANSNPTYMMDINGSLRAASNIVLHGSNVTRLSMGIVYTAGQLSTNSLSNDVVVRTDTGNLIFQSGSGSAALCVSSNNNVGIKTTTPQHPLDVNGVARASSFISTTTTGTAPLTVSSTTKVTNLNADLLNGQYASYYAVPIGCILLWYGSTGTIPSGWALCDGTLYGSVRTPDLRNRFVIGAGSTYSPDVTGGSSTVTLTTSNLPSHSHTGTTSNVADHTHSVSIASAGGHTHTHSLSAAGGHNHTGTTDGGGSHVHQWHWTGTSSQSLDATTTGVTKGGSYDSGGTASPFISDPITGDYYTSLPSYTGTNHHTHTYTTSSIADHTHTLTVNAVSDHTHTLTQVSAGGHSHTFTTTNTGSGTAVNTMPPYYALCYIMRIA